MKPDNKRPPTRPSLKLLKELTQGASRKPALNNYAKAGADLRKPSKGMGLR